MPIFTRFTETINKKEKKRIVSITVKPTVTDCTGTVWFTDLMLQETAMLSGYVINTETMLKKYATGDEYAITGKRFFNGIVRGSATCIIFNLGKTSTGLDWKVYPNQDMKAGSVSLGLGAGAHKAIFTDAASAGDELSLLASSRECLKNGSATAKDGFFQYSAAGDSKHPVTVEEKKSAKLYVEFQEMEDGDVI
ncbi:hypothetical protein EDD59_10683 [Muricomes intestini]|jgi:hypothetical protein|uniref:Uncharacterized protein n=1 Tax=Muricomes intestini TaxID=1796634 RepID=A0A4R3KB40_9FIRM|nr:hypothetical protein [Muricomes intestini]TCS80257.1 hypothetical protein EDD59_10683 [Muricomes intestini]